ncbi:SGNH hydrolase-type esterase domain-containing protein [Lophiotrema nucula]|uniref:SGNH hydrolase-type esterase domain-containing protein n=1 Tax=Lophiotrema nucula TaxID=690887 RepID=A0A6A5Z3B7_9PLEO|nr:SGNH hydrolase-type esterase domain-containing protein [Lophiotrema nucula]
MNPSGYFMRSWRELLSVLAIVNPTTILGAIRLQELLGFIFVLQTVIAQEYVDLYDLSFLVKGAAIGDSYAAGIGAGNEVDWSCSRYDGSYPSLVALQLGVDPKVQQFTYTACSGAVISGVVDQAKSLSGGQQYIIISAGGNDADLVGILNSCVYSFYAGLHHPSCESKLAESRATIASSKLASDLDGLIGIAKSKLAKDGNIYYGGYAGFFDSTDKTCDSVSWNLWGNVYTKTREYLTMSRRQAMNDVVNRMNDALRLAVARAGPQVHFVDYDKYVEMTNGRYCQPGQDESAGNGANRDYLFFYQMQSRDAPWLTNDLWPNDELRRRSNPFNDDGNIEPANATLNALYGALMQQAIEENEFAALDDHNANDDLKAEVFVQKKKVVELSTRGSLTVSNLAFGNHTASANTSHPSTVIANNTHIRLENGTVVEKVNVKKLILSDKTCRVFHPTQGGHALIANLVLYHMQANNAKAKGAVDFPAEEVWSGSEPPQLGGPACNTGSSGTWTTRDTMMSAVNSFCAEPRNLRGVKGTKTYASFGRSIALDYTGISIDWRATTNISQHSCLAWFSVVTDGCDVPGPAGQNPDNLKHGGAIPYASDVGVATLKIEPLVVRRMWDKGVGTGQKCNDVSSRRYLDQPTLEQNFKDFCTKSAATWRVALAGSKFQLSYNDGTPDHVVITIDWPPGPYNYEIFEEECSYYMAVLTNGCSLPGPNNLMNWKHGGSISDNNGIKYTLEPNADRPLPLSEPRGSCHVERHGIFFEWDIFGAGFATNDWGQSKGGLRDQIQGCGILSDWKFEYYDTLQTNGAEWHASGKLRVGMKAYCIGRAIESAGGFQQKC